MRTDAERARAPLSTLHVGMTASGTHMSGADRYFLALLRTLPLSGVHVRGILLGDPASVDRPVTGVEAFAPAGASRWRRWRGIRDSVGRLRRGADLVVSHGVPHLFPALDRLGGLPLVVHFHGPWAREARAEGRSATTVMVRRVQERAVLARASRYIVLSRAFGDMLVRDFNVREDDIRVVPGGVDLDTFTTPLHRAAARAVCGLPADRPIVLCVSRLSRAKGLSALVAAMRLVRAGCPDALLVIAGSGPFAPALGRQIDAAGIGQTVRLCGHVGADLPRLYRAADVSIVPSNTFEGFGLVVIESLALGTPALVTPIGGLPEAVGGLDRNFVLEGNEPQHLAAGILDVFDGRLRAPDAAACRSYAARFSWPQIAGRVADVYAELAGA